MLISRLLAFMGILTGLTMPAMSCDQYESIESSELKAMRDALVDPETDAFDRLTAFQIMACSDQSSIRSYAIDIAKASDDPLLQSEVVVASLLELDQLDVQLFESEGQNERAARLLDESGGALSYVVVHKDRSSGCISFGATDRCEVGMMASANGSTVEFAFVRNTGITGAFSLTEDGDMIGYVVVQRQGNSGRVPARLRLFP